MDINFLEKQAEKANKAASIATKNLEDAKYQLSLIKLEPLKEVAILLHDSLCRYNPTDACSWHYEINGNEHYWDSYTHRKWLQHVDNLIHPSIYDKQKALTVEQIKDIVTSILDLKKKHGGDILWIIRHRLEIN